MIGATHDRMATRFAFDALDLDYEVLHDERPTVCVSGRWAGWDSAWEQKKPEARRILVNRADSHTATAPFVGRSCCARLAD